MRFHNFSLKCYGGFEQETLSFPQRSQDLHIIYGLNEAGKSTLLRAFRDFLFGFPKQTQGENWKYRTNLIRLGACFSHDGQTQTAWRRRPSIKGDFFGEDDTTLLKPSLLIQAYDHLTAKDFFLSWALDHKRLAEGGREIASERQDAEKTSLAKELGHIDNLSDVITTLKKEKEYYWVKTQKKTIIRELVNKYQAVKKALRTETTLPKKLQEAQETVQSLREHHNTIRLRQSALTHELSQCERAQALINPYHSYQTAKRLFEERPDTLLNKDDSETIISLFLQKASVEHLYQQEQAHLESYERELTSLGERPSLLDEETRISFLIRDENNYSKNQHEFQERDQRYEQLRQKKATLLTRLSLSDTELLPSLTQLEPLLALSKEYDKIAERLRERQRAYTDEATSLTALPTPPQTEALQDIKDWLNNARAYATLECDYDTLTHSLAIQKDTLTNTLPALSPWKASFDDARAQLQKLALPSEDECRIAIKVMQDYEEQARQAEQKSIDAQETYDQEELTYQQLSRSPEWVSEEHLTQARKERDDALKCIDTKTVSADQLKALEEKIQSADHLSDQRFLSAQTDAQLQKIRHHQERLKLHITQAQQKEAKAHQKRHQAQKQWEARLVETGMPPVSPQRLAVWREKRLEVLKLYESYNDTHAKWTNLSQKKQNFINALQNILPVQDTNSFTHLIKKMENHYNELEQRQKHYERTVQQHTIAQKVLNDLKSKRERARLDLEEWHTLWNKAAQRAQYPNNLSHDDLNVFQNLIQTHKDLLSVANEKQNKDAERSDTQRQSQQLLEHYQAPSLEALNKRLAEAKREDEQRHSLLERKQDTQHKLTENGESLKLFHDKLTQFLHHLPKGHTVNDLHHYAQRDGETARYRDNYYTAQNTLLEIGRGQSLDEIIASVDTLDDAQIDTKKAEIREENAALDLERDRAHQNLLHAETVLAELEAKDDASKLSEDIQQLKARIEEESAHYVSLHTQYQLLQHMLNQQKEKLHGPFLNLASTFFSRLTLGEYEELALEEDDKNALTFIGLRPGRTKAVPLKYMSEGTCDQLYLALRLADIHQKLDAGISLPFFADDLFITFDDKRTKAGMELLAELSQRTQVFFFTHHLSTLDHLPPDKAQRLFLSAHA